MPDLLAAIVAASRRRVEVCEQIVPAAELIRRLDGADRAGAFVTALNGTDGFNVIAECKRRSPSRGVLRGDYDVVAIAQAYRDAGARAISVLTEPTFFDGSLTHLQSVAAAVALPTLRKDFTVAEYQVYEAAAAGASAVLLIVAALEDDELRRLLSVAADVGLAALVEVHTREELDRALGAGARIVGVNNRNLRTLAVSLRTAWDLVAHIPAGVVRVAESGLRAAADLAQLHDAGYDAFLIGEAFMACENPGAELTRFLRDARAASTEGGARTMQKEGGVR